MSQMPEYNQSEGVLVQPLVGDRIYELCDVLTGLEVHRRTPNIAPELMNLAYDSVLETIMDLYHDIQEDRRELNSRIRRQRHQARLAAHRERSMAQRIAAQPAIDVMVQTQAARRAPRLVQPVDRLFPVKGLTKPKIKALKQIELEAQMPDSCGICMEVNTRGNSVVTECGHGFCKECFDQYIESIRMKSFHERELRCPMCRKVGPKCTVFRLRKVPVRKPKAPQGLPVTTQEVDELAGLMDGITI
jgi:Ring finger domain